MGQTVLKSKSLIIALFILFLVLSNLCLFTGINTTINPPANDCWLQMADNLSHQAIIPEDHRPNFSFLYKPWRFNFGVFKVIRFEYQLFHMIVSTPVVLIIVGLFFLIYYQLSRTSSESGPYGFIISIKDN